MKSPVDVERLKKTAKVRLTQKTRKKRCLSARATQSFSAQVASLMNALPTFDKGDDYYSYFWRV
jgi:hypothetical protein